MRHFTCVDSDIDYSVYERFITGRITKARYKAIARYCRNKSVSFPVYSDYDCTGQCTGEYYSFSIVGDSIKITLTVNFDY